jgi:Protein of unknown function (DUF3667)
MSAHTTTCLNCGTPVTTKFCPNCGQKTVVKRLNWHVFAEEIRYFYNMQNGFFKTTFELAVHPGRLYKNYLDGKRKKYYQPLNYLLICITIFLVVYQTNIAIVHLPSANTATLLTNDPQTKAMIDKYRSMIELVILPFTSFVVLLVVAYPKLNYVEVFSIAFYAYSFLFILLALQFVVAMILGINSQTNAFDLTAICIYIAWSLYSFYSFYRKYSIRFLIPRIVLALVTCSLLWFVLARLIVKVMLALHVK